MKTRAIRLGGALLIAAALVVTGCGGGPAAEPSPAAPAYEQPIPMQEPEPAPEEPAPPAAPAPGPEDPPGGGPGDGPSGPGGGGGGPAPPTDPLDPYPPGDPDPSPTPPATRPPADPLTAVPGADLTPPAACCGCAGGTERGWGWMTRRSDGVCGWTGTYVPGLCGCFYGGNGRWYGSRC